MNPAVDLWNVSGNLGIEILNNLNSVKNMLKHVHLSPSEFHKHGI